VSDRVVPCFVDVEGSVRVGVGVRLFVWRMCSYYVEKLILPVYVFLT
jgi:hypothetical protein